MTTPAHDLAAVLDLIVDSVTIQDANGRLVHANAVAARRLGFATPEELLKADPSELAVRYTMYDEHGALFPRDRLPGRLVLAGQEAPDVLLRYRDELTGEDHWAIVYAAALTAADGTRCVVNVARDVTEQVVAETALREREARLRAVLAAMPDLMFMQDPDGTFLDFHADDETKLFVPPNTFLGKRPVDVLPPEVAEVLVPALKHTAQTGELTAVEYAMPMADEERHYEARTVRLDDSRLLSIVRDLTDRFRAEAALKELRSFEEGVAAASPAILYIYDFIENRNVYVNDALPRLLGYAPEQLIEAGAADLEALMHPDDLARWPVWGGQVAAAADGEVVEQSFRLRHADGSWRWLAQRVTVLSREPDGRPRLIVAAALDVTALREAEEALRASEARYRAVVDTQTEMISRYLPGTAILTFVNDAHCRFLGKTKEDILGRSILDFTPESSQERLMTYFQSLATDPRRSEVEHEVNLPDGTVGIQHWVDVPVFDEAGTVVEFQGIGRDVTALRQAEEALAASKRLADRVGAASPDIIYVYDVLASRTVYVNDAIGRVLGYSPAQLADAEATDPMAMRHPDDLATLQAAVAQVASADEGAVVEFDFRLRHADGSWRWLAARATVLEREPDGQPRLVVGAASDVTALRETEAALRESEARYRAVVESQSEMICRYLPGTAVLTFVNDAYCRARRQPRDELLGRSILDVVSGEAREKLSTYFRSLATDPRRSEVEHEVYLPDGTVGIQHWVDFPIYDAAGTVVEFQGIGRDVTGLRRAEEALRESEERYRSVVDLQTELVSRYLPDTTLTFVNDTYCRFFSQTREQLISTPFLPSLAPSERTAMIGIIDSIMAYSEPVTYEHSVVLPDGSIRHLQWVDRAVRDPDGQVVELQGVGRDVTDLRRAEQALRANEERQAFLLQLSDALRPLGDPTQIQATATNLLREHLSTGWCYYVEWDESALLGVVARDATRPGLPSLAGSHDVSEGPEFLEFLRSGKSFNVTDYETYDLLSPQLRKRYMALGFRSMIGTPLVKDGRLVATLAVVDTEPRKWQDEELHLTREVAERTWAALERAQAEAGLRESEEHLRLAIDSAAMGTWDWRVDSNWISWSHGTGKLCGLPADTPGITLDDYYVLVHPDDRELMRAQHEGRNPEQDEYFLEFRTVWHDGSVHWLERKGKAVERDADGRATRFLGVTVDVTARKQSEATLRRLSHQLLKVQDDERRRLARELHDGVAQDVFAITVALGSIEQGSRRLSARAREVLSESQNLAEQALRELRSRAYLLHPPILDMAGLAPTLREYASGLARRGEFHVDASGVEDVARLPADVETALFRVAQEALANVIRHAGTGRATLTLSSQGDVVELRVHDQGKGRTLDEPPLGTHANGVGIPSMRERLRQIGGELDVASGPGWTTITARARMNPSTS